MNNDSHLYQYDPNISPAENRRLKKERANEAVIITIVMALALVGFAFIYVRWVIWG